MKNLTLFFYFSLLASVLSAQTKHDRLYLHDDVKEVTVEEVGANAIKYKHPNENTSYVISRHQVKKIEFSSGRIEVFETPYKPVNALRDYENVYVTYSPQDIEGMQAKGGVYSKAVGVTALSSINNVQNRAVKKIKMEAAMLGANVILIGNTYQRGNHFGNEYTAANSTMTALSGTAYSTERKDLSGVLDEVKNNRYLLYQIDRLNRNAWDSKTETPITTDREGNMLLLTFDEAYIRDGELFVKSKDLKPRKKELKVIHADDVSVTLMVRDGKKITNYYLLSEKDSRVKKGIEIMESRVDKVK
ncbi:MAG TPA: hypothetical protein VK014_07070 [Cyclobacteriaceae bacterium]|nr:hypothetical protein [Cyclobacteriaceae bacterium]